MISTQEEAICSKLGNMVQRSDQYVSEEKKLGLQLCHLD